MRNLLAALLLLVVLAAAYYLSAPDPPVRVASAAVERGDVESVMITNGRIETSERLDVYAETAGRVAAVAVEPGATVAKGQVLARLDDAAARLDLRAAEARLTSALAARQALNEPLTPAERADLENRVATAGATLGRLETQLQSVERLIARSAAATAEKDDLLGRIADLEAERALARKKLEMGAMKSAIEQSEAQVREARTAVEAARGAVAAAVLRSPAAGEVYSLNLVAGGYVRPGDLAARIAGAAGVAARVYVDEPELGRIRPGVTATLSADAYPDKSWTCAIERLPTEIVELGSRRVGEALCAIEAPGPELIPNLTIGVEIRTGFSANTLTLPRQAVELAGGAARVWIRDEQGTAQQRLVSLGVLGVDRVEIVSGLSEGERVLLPAAGSLKDGERVEAIS